MDESIQHYTYSKNVSMNKRNIFQRSAEGNIVILSSVQPKNFELYVGSCY